MKNSRNSLTRILRYAVVKLPKYIFRVGAQARTSWGPRDCASRKPPALLARRGSRSRIDAAGYDIDENSYEKKTIRLENERFQGR